MLFRIETKEAFQIVGKYPLSKVLEENIARIPQEWDRALENGMLSELHGSMNNKPEGLLGVSVHNEKEWRYFIAVSSTEHSDGFEKYDIPDIEVYIKANPDDAIYEYWLPVVKKEDNSGCINNES